MGSMYVQSFLGTTFATIEQDLVCGQEVLFVGTPCQCAGLVSYVQLKGIKSDKLYICDLICHGVSSPKLWKELIGDSDRIESVQTWEMDCFDKAWDDWLATNKKFALSDRQHFETIIKPYTCFVGIYIKLKKAL